MKVYLSVVNTKTGIEEPITDLYWFEENGVHDFDGEGHFSQYKFRMNLVDEFTHFEEKDMEVTLSGKLLTGKAYKLRGAK